MFHPRSRTGLLLFLGALLTLAACSTRKNNAMSRGWHRLLSRDNGWFNANLKLNEINDGIEKAYVYNFDEILPVFIHGTPEQAKAAVPEVEKCIEKCNTVIKRHSMEFEGKQKNRWIADSYFVIGKSHYTKQAYAEAERRFSFMGRKFKGHDLFYEAKLWGARCAVQMEQYAKAQSLLDEIAQAPELPKSFPRDQRAAVQADLDLKRGKVDDAITSLQKAVEEAQRKNDRVRWAFILAQLYDYKGRGQEAITQFRRVTQMNPPYEIDFHARIYQALSFDAGNSKGLRKTLNRMLRDDKHVDHFDMIHYALADLDLKEGNDSNAIAHLKTSSRVNTTDTKQKAKTFLKLADVYFDDRAYVDAQKYYDSTRTVLAEEHKRYEEVVNKADVLTELVEQINIINREDSLQGVAAMSEEDRDKLIKRKIRERERQEEDRKAAEEEARAVENSGVVPGKPVQPGNNAGGGGGWYFYNPQSLSRGMAEFKKKWGPRVSEDDWRRKDKSGNITEMAEEVEEEKEGEKEEGAVPDWQKEETYLKDLPKDSADIMASNERICEALYKSGMIYKEKLDDDDNAVESFENLNTRFDDCRYTPESHYQLYRIYLGKEQKANYFSPDGGGSQQYANIILERWPNSEFARLVRDPNVLASDEERKLRETEKYKQQFEQFKRGNYLAAQYGCDSVLLNEPQNHLRAKHHLLKAMCIGNMRIRDGFIAALTEVKQQYPGTDEAKGAEEILGNLQQSVQESNGEPAGPAYKFEDGKHYFAVVVPNGKADVNTVKTKLLDFNNSYFPGTTVQVQASFLDPQRQIVQVTLFDTKADVMNFLDLYNNDKQFLTGINDQAYPAFAISPDNYAELYKSKDVDAYLAFFAANYQE